MSQKPLDHLVRSERAFKCAICERPLHVESVSTGNPEAPELVAIHTGTWVGIIAGDAGPELVTVCSRVRLGQLRCLDAFFALDASSSEGEA